MSKILVVTRNGFVTAVLVSKSMRDVDVEVMSLDSSSEHVLRNSQHRMKDPRLKKVYPRTW